MKTRLLVISLQLFLCVSLSALHGPAESKILRSRKEVQAFRLENPCPSTGLLRGACPGYQVDHTIALCAGGPDHRSNMFWLSVEDHKFKTFTDLRECRKLRENAGKPAA